MIRRPQPAGRREYRGCAWLVVVLEEARRGALEVRRGVEVAPDRSQALPVSL
jgi:hypothetical protein